MIDFDVCFLSISAKNEPPLHLNLKYTWLICTPGRQLALIQAIVSSKQNIINISNVFHNGRRPVTHYLCLLIAALKPGKALHLMADAFKA